MRQVMKLIAGIAAALIVFVGFSGVASAQDGYEPTGGCEFFDFEYPTQVTAGGTLEVTNGVSSEPGVEISLKLGEYALGGSLTTDDDGDFAGSFTVPADIPPGTYELYAICNGVEYESPVGAQVEVLPAADVNPDRPGGGGGAGGESTRYSGEGHSGTNTGGTPLARTGFDARPVATLGAAALVLGAAAVYGSRRRRSLV